MHLFFRVGGSILYFNKNCNQRPSMPFPIFYIFQTHFYVLSIFFSSRWKYYLRILDKDSALQKKYTEVRQVKNNLQEINSRQFYGVQNFQGPNQTIVFHPDTKNLQCRRPLLFADFLFANSLIHIEKMVQNDNFPVKMDFLSANSRFVVRKDRMYLPPKTRETCTSFSKLWYVFHFSLPCSKY